MRAARRDAAKPLRASIIGMGHQGKKHAKVLDELGVEWVEGQESKVDFAIISCPDEFHYQYVMNYLKAGIPVFCEKPLCLHPHELEDIEDRVRRTDGILSMNLPMRSRVILTPDPYRVDASYNWGRKDEKRDWKKGDPHLVGGIHLLDLMIQQMGRVVDAETVRTDLTAASIIQFERGIGTLTSDLNSPPPHRHHYHCWGEHHDWSYERPSSLPDAYGLQTFVGHLRGVWMPMVPTEDVLSLMHDVFKL
jgi:hypothetical protein